MMNGAKGVKIALEGLICEEKNVYWSYSLHLHYADKYLSLVCPKMISPQEKMQYFLVNIK